jgi:hypothetical protein
MQLDTWEQMYVLLRWIRHTLPCAPAHTLNASPQSTTCPVTTPRPEPSILIGPGCCRLSSAGSLLMGGLVVTI